MAHDVFVSYSSKDKTVADAVVAGLEQDGLRCWVAPRDVLAGTTWGEAIVEAIEACHVMVLILSESSNESRQVLREVQRAVESETIILPFRIEAIDPSGAMGYFLATEHWLDALAPPLEQHINALAASIRALMAGALAPTAAQPPAAPSAQTVQVGQVVEAVVQRTSMDIVTLSLPNDDTGKIFSPHRRLLLVFMPFGWLSRRYKVGDHLMVKTKRQWRTGTFSCEPFTN